jgi:hypothetical protein
VSGDLVSRLLAAIDETAENAVLIHSCDCLTTRWSEGLDSCDCPQPDRIRRRCAADRKLIEAASKWVVDIDEHGNYKRQPGDTTGAQEVTLIESLAGTWHGVLETLAAGYGITEEDK